MCPPACGDRPVAPAATGTSYLDYTGRADLLGGGVRMIPIRTPKGEFRVWTKRVGNSPRMKVLLLHGGPAATHEYFEAFDSYFPAAGIEYYYYDQLGSAYSDQPNDPELWTLPRSWMKSTRCGRRWDSTRAICTCSDTPGAGCSPLSTRSRTSST
jgi:proline iminopeptidase